MHLDLSLWKCMFCVRSMQFRNWTEVFHLDSLQFNFSFELWHQNPVMCVWKNVHQYIKTTKEKNGIFSDLVRCIDTGLAILVGKYTSQVSTAYDRRLLHKRKSWKVSKTFLLLTALHTEAKGNWFLKYVKVEFNFVNIWNISNIPPAAQVRECNRRGGRCQSGAQNTKQLLPTKFDQISAISLMLQVLAFCWIFVDNSSNIPSTASLGHKIPSSFAPKNWPNHRQ